MIRAILVPLDGSSLAERALPWAETLTRATGGSLTLLRVITDDGREGVLDEVAEARSYLTSIKAELKTKGLAASIRVGQGRPAEAILRAARKADLIVMATHGRSGVNRWALGNVADKVLHGTQLPLLLVRADRGGRARRAEIRRILVPLDGSPLSKSALPLAEELARSFDASLLLCHVVQTMGIGPSNPIVMLTMEKEAAHWVSTQVRLLKRKGVRVAGMTERGWVVNTILGCSQRGDADLIVMATHGRSGMGRLTIGSIADAVVRRAAIPCLVVRPPAVAAGKGDGSGAED